jgi:hypothetical protein
MEHYLWLSVLSVCMSADRRAPGIKHMTVVPENFEPSADREGDDDPEAGGEA